MNQDQPQLSEDEVLSPAEQSLEASRIMEQVEEENHFVILNASLTGKVWDICMISATKKLTGPAFLVIDNKDGFRINEVVISGDDEQSPLNFEDALHQEGSDVPLIDRVKQLIQLIKENGSLEGVEGIEGVREIGLEEFREALKPEVSDEEATSPESDVMEKV